MEEHRLELFKDQLNELIGKEMVHVQYMRMLSRLNMTLALSNQDRTKVQVMDISFHDYPLPGDLNYVAGLVSRASPNSKPQVKLIEVGISIIAYEPILDIHFKHIKDVHMRTIRNRVPLTMMD